MSEMSEMSEFYNVYHSRRHTNTDHTFRLYYMAGAEIHFGAKKKSVLEELLKLMQNDFQSKMKLICIFL